LPASPAAVATEPDAIATPPVDTVNRIVFVDTTGRVGTVAPDGSASRLLTEGGATYQFPAWSPDSQQIAAVGNDGSEGGVYIWPDEAGAASDELYSSRRRPPIYLYWSPDGRQVSFLANDRGGLGLWLARADGSAPAQQIASGQPFYWQWSQGSDQLFVHSGGPGPDAQLAWLEPDANQASDNVASPGLFQAPGISADGRYLAFGQRVGQRFQVAVQEVAGGRRSTAPHSGMAALSWSPAAPHLAWTSPRADQFSSAGPLRLLEADSGDIFVLVRDTVLAFFWAPDGQSIAYLTLASGGNDAGAGRPAGLAAMAPSPAGQHSALSLRLWVVDVATGQQRQLYTFRPSEIFLTQFLPFFDQYALSHRLWSPASDALVLPMLDSSGAAGIYVVPVNGGEAVRVAGGTMAFWSWR
jgi:TolB protein